MKALTWRRSGLQVDERDAPTPASGWALLRPELVGLCGTDLTIVSGRHGRATPPLVLGHEFTAILVDDVDRDLVAGTRVAVRPTLPCGECWPCRHGLSHTCRRLQLLGIDVDGALAELCAAPIANLVALPDSVPALEAVLTEPLAVAIHAVRRAGEVRDRDVLIVGGGPIGVLTALVAAHHGGRVLISEPAPLRREMAENLGFPTVGAGSDLAHQVEAATSGQMADVVFDCAAHRPTAARLSALAHERGVVVLVALYADPAPVDLHGIAFTEQLLLGSRVYTESDFAAAAGLIADDALQLARLPVQVFPLTDATAAVEAARAGSALKVAIRPSPPQ